MAYPGPKVHRPSRRKLGRGQYPQTADATVTVTAHTTTSADLTFNEPMVIAGPVNFTVATLTPVAQTIISPTVVRFDYGSGTVATKTWTFPASQPNLATPQGGGVVGSAGTFP